MRFLEACEIALRINQTRWPRFVVLRMERGPSLTEERYHIVVWRADDQTQLVLQTPDDTRRYGIFDGPTSLADLAAGGADDGAEGVSDQ